MTDSAKKYDRDACLRTFAAVMQNQAATLERDIRAEEERSRRFDPTDVTYPMLARSLRERHSKVASTIATLASVMQPEPTEPSQAA